MGRSRHGVVCSLRVALSVLATLIVFASPALEAASAEPAFDLLDYVRTHVEDPDRASIPKYNREQHYGRWINADPDVNCFNTRNEVLYRDADKTAPLTIEQTTPRVCKIVKGLWHDPYTGQDRTDAAKAIEIDHVVPLRNSYYAGAHQWNYARRCHYANYLENDYHLLAVDTEENEKKLDNGPEEYMPPNTAYHCRYLSIWMRIKAIWGLNVTSKERDAILDLAEKRACEEKDLTMPVRELKEQRRFALQPSEACVRAEEKKKRELIEGFGDPEL